MDIFKSNSNNIGYQVKLRFSITQHSRDKELLELIIKYLGAGVIEHNPKRSFVDLVISKISDINQIIIPFLNKNPIKGIKHLDYLDWCKIAYLMSSGLHHTKEGIEEIQQIRSGMNSLRKI